MRYFLTGATGFVGGHIARQLRTAGHEVVALVRSPGKAGDLRAMGVEIHEGDITDKASMRAPMTGVDGLFHVAAWYQVGARDSSRAERINVGGTRNVLELMRELDVPKGVYTSTLAVFGDTNGVVADEHYRFDPVQGFASEYDRTKWMAHYEVALPMMAEGLPLVIVQPGLVYGPGDQNASQETLVAYLQGKLPMAPAKAQYAWGHVEDVARAHLLAMEKGTPGETYIIAGPVHSLVEALEIAERLTGVPAPRVRVPEGVLSVMAGLMGLVNRVVPLPTLYHPETLRSTNATYIGSNAKARRELGYDPRPLEEGLRETLAYEMAQLGMQPRGSAA